MRKYEEEIIEAINSYEFLAGCEPKQLAREAWEYFIYENDIQDDDIEASENFDEIFNEIINE